MVNSIPVVLGCGKEHIGKCLDNYSKCFLCSYQDLARLKQWLSPDKAFFPYSAPPVAKGSYHWLLEHKSLHSWLNSSQEGILWIHGKPGSGKTTLMKYLVDGFHNHTIDSYRPTITSVFFCHSSQSLQREKGSV